MPSQVDVEKLRQGLVQDYLDSEKLAQESAVARGAPEDSSFSPKALRFKNKAVGEAELMGSKSAIEDAVKRLTEETGLSDEIERGKFEMGLRKKMNQFRLMLMQKAGEFEMELNKRNFDQRKKQALIKAFGGLAEGVSEGIVANLGKKTALTATQTGLRGPTGAPTLGVDTNFGVGQFPGLS